MDRMVPSLKIWLYVFVIELLVLGGFFGFAQFKYPDIDMTSDAYSENLRNAIAKNDAIKANNKSIVIFGSSLSRCALPYITDIQGKTSDSTCKTIILRISVSALNTKKTIYSNFFNYITSTPPDYLFLENNKLNIDDDIEKPNPPFSILADDMKRHLKRLIGLRENDFNDLPQMSATPGFYTGVFNGYVSKEALTRKRLVRKFSENEALNSAIVKLIKRKTKVIFLDFPVSPKIRPVVFTADYRRKLQLLLNDYYCNYGVECWKYPDSLSNADFADLGHLNYRGAKKYSNWFVKRVNSLK